MNVVSKNDGVQKIGLFLLFIQIFSNVGSGPSGIEGIVGAGGIALATIGIVVFPLFWGYVQALVAAEMASQYPQINGGISAWALHKFGKVAAFNCAVWEVILNCSTAAFVSETSVAYISTLYPEIDGYWFVRGVTIAVIALSMLINSVNIKFTSKIFVAFSANALLTFIVLIVFSFVRGLDVKRFDSPRKHIKSVNWSELVNLLVYNSAGYDSASSIIKEVYNPMRNMPIAMTLVGFFVCFLYLATLIIPYLATKGDYTEWSPGYFAVVAHELGGVKLQKAIVAASLLTNLQIYVASLQTAMYTTASMAEQGVFPFFLAATTQEKINEKTREKEVKKNPPWSAMALCGIISVVFGFATIQLNLTVEGVVYSAIMLLEVAVFLTPENKPILVTKNIWVRRAISAPTICLCVWVLIVQERWSLFGSLSVLLLFVALSLRQLTPAETAAAAAAADFAEQVSQAPSNEERLALLNEETSIEQSEKVSNTAAVRRRNNAFGSKSYLKRIDL